MCFDTLPNEAVHNQDAFWWSLVSCSLNNVKNDFVRLLCLHLGRVVQLEDILVVDSKVLQVILHLLACFLCVFYILICLDLSARRFRSIVRFPYSFVVRHSKEDEKYLLWNEVRIFQVFLQVERFYHIFATLFI